MTIYSVIQTWEICANRAIKPNLLSTKKGIVFSLSQTTEIKGGRPQPKKKKKRFKERMFGLPRPGEQRATTTNGSLSSLDQHAVPIYNKRPQQQLYYRNHRDSREKEKKEENK
jgi:hypothetical protein